MVVVALLSVDLVESVDLVSVYLVVNCTTFLPASALEPWEYQTCATPNPIHFILLFMDVGEK